MKKKVITIDDLARMVQKGFEATATKEETATKKDLNQLKSEMNERFDKIERLILTDHKKRIEKLEQDMRQLKNALAI